MKKIEALVPRYRLDEIDRAFEHPDIHLVTIAEVTSRTRQPGTAVVYRGHTYTSHLVPKLKIDIIADDTAVPSVIATLRTLGRGARGEPGGEIFVTAGAAAPEPPTEERRPRRLASFRGRLSQV